MVGPGPPVRRGVCAWVPATFLDLFVLSIATGVLIGLTGDIVESILREHSTNLERCGRTRYGCSSAARSGWTATCCWCGWSSSPWCWHPSSGGWAPCAGWWCSWPARSAPRWRRRQVCGWRSAGGVAPSSLSDVVDVGVSLGFAALAAVFTYRLPRPGRWYWAGGLLVAAGGAAIVGGTFTDFGHRAAVMIGFAMYPITRSANVRGRPGGGEPRRQRHVGVGRRRAHGRVDLRRPAGSRDQPVLPDSPVRWRAAFGVGPADGRAPRNRLSMTWSAVAQRWARTRQSRAGRSAPATGRATVSARSTVRSIPAAARSASTASGV